MCVYLTVRTEIVRAEIRFSRDGRGDCTHLLRDTDGEDTAAGLPGGQRARTGDCLPSRSGEVSLTICVSEVTTLRSRCNNTQSTVRSQTDVKHVCRSLIMLP